MTALISNNNISESRKYIDKSMALVLAYSNAVAFGIFAVGKLFAVVYYGKDFEKTGIIMILLAVTIVFLGCGNVVRTQYLIPNKHDKIYIYSAIIGAVVNLVINGLLIPKYASVGAAIGTIAAEFCVLFYQLYSIRKELNLKEYAHYEAVFAFIGVIMVVVINMLPESNSSAINLAVKIFAGGCVYVIIAGFYLVKAQQFKIPGFYGRGKKK